MKLFIKKIIQLSLISLVLYILLLIVWGELVPNGFKNNLLYSVTNSSHTYSRLRDISNYKNSDVLVLGSSHAYRGYDPRIFNSAGFKTFNLGSSSQTPIQTELLLNKYLDFIHPKIVIYEISPDCFTNDGVESSLDIIATDQMNWQTFLMAIKVNNIKTYNSLIFALYRNLFNRNNVQFEKYTKENDNYISGGFVEKNSLAFKNIGNIGLENNQWKPINYQIQAFNNIISLLRNKKIKIIFVQAPVTKYQYQLFDENKKFDNYINSIDLYYNYNDSILLHDSLHFNDRNHLNQAGVEIFNNSLIENVLKKENLFYR